MGGRENRPVPIANPIQWAMPSRLHSGEAQASRLGGQEDDEEREEEEGRGRRAHETLQRRVHHVDQPRRVEGVPVHT